MLSKNFCIKENEDFGKYVIALRNFDLGEELFEEPPLIVAPSERCNVDSILKYSCVGCCRILTDEKMRCPDCLWLCCSIECAQKGEHKKCECDILSRKQISVSSKIFGYIIFIRWAIYKEREPKNYEGLMSLCDKYPELKSDFRDHVKDEVTSLWMFLTETCDLEVTKKEVSKWYKIHKVNSFNFKSGFNSSSLYTGCSFYEIGCLFSHSCSPNLEFSFRSVVTERDEMTFNIRLVARKRIESGDALTITYGPELRFGTVLRQLEIRKARKFVCRCARCKDRTEEGTLMSGLLCPNCVTGYLIPMDSLGEKTFRWKCGYCNLRKRGSYAKKIVLSLFEGPLKLFNLYSADADSLGFADEFIDLYGASILHRNHYLITQCGVYWLLFGSFTQDLLGHSESSAKLFFKIMTRLRRFLPLCEKFGFPPITARLNFVYAQVLATFLFKSKNMIGLCPDALPRNKLLRVCNRILSKLKLSLLWSRMDLDPNQSDWEINISKLICVWLDWKKIFTRHIPVFVFDDNILEDIGNLQL